MPGIPCLSQNAKERDLLDLRASIFYRMQHSHPLAHSFAPPNSLPLPADSHILIKYRCYCKPLSGSHSEFINSRCRQPVIAVTLEEWLLFHFVVLMMLQEIELKVECEVASWTAFLLELEPLISDMWSNTSLLRRELVLSDHKDVGLGSNRSLSGTTEQVTPNCNI